MLEIFESWEDFVRVSKNFHVIEACEVRKLYKVRKLKLLTPFQNTKAFFHQTSNFSFIEPHETNFFIVDCENLFSIESHEIHLRIEWDLFLHDLESKSFHMKSSWFFQFLVEFSSPMHDFGCSTIFVKFMILRTCSTHNNMRIGNQVQNLSKCTIKLPKSFHHL